MIRVVVVVVAAAAAAAAAAVTCPFMISSIVKSFLALGRNNNGHV